MNKKVDLKLDWATHESAKYACENWHYSECMPAGKLVKIGVWENGNFIGVVIFGLGATPNLSKQYNLTMQECCELTRIALKNHETPVSRIVRISIKFLLTKCPKLKLVVSFADAAQNHHGGIYQAGNWIYSGSVELDHWLINNKKMHPRSVVMKYGTQAMAAVLKIDKNAKKIWGIKHRYLMPLDTETKNQITKLAKPYPKRVEHEINADGFQSSESGAIPTNTIQKTRRVG